jgi:ABC-type transporter Mla MlaB component
MTRASAQLADKGEGRCSIAGALTIETAPWLWQQLQAGGLLGTAKQADLSGVVETDSAGLALLAAWRASCRQQGGDVRFSAVPARLLALAHLTQSQTLLEP